MALGHPNAAIAATRLLWGSPISTQTTSGRSPLQAVDKSHHAHHETRVSSVVSTAKTVIRPPVHPFRLDRERFEHALAPSQLHPDLLRPSKTALAHGFLLAFIGQAAAVPTREQFSSTVKNRNSTPTISTAGRDGKLNTAWCCISG